MPSEATQNSFIATDNSVQGLLGHVFYHFRDPPHLALNPSINQSQLKHENPITPWLFGNGKARLKTFLHLEKTMP